MVWPRGIAYALAAVLLFSMMGILLTSVLAPLNTAVGDSTTGDNCRAGTSLDSYTGQCIPYATELTNVTPSQSELDEELQLRQQAIQRLQQCDMAGAEDLAKKVYDLGIKIRDNFGQIEQGNRVLEAAKEISDAANALARGQEYVGQGVGIVEGLRLEPCTPLETENFKFRVDVSPHYQSVLQGQVAVISVTVTLLEGEPGIVTLKSTQFPLAKIFPWFADPVVYPTDTTYLRSEERRVGKECRL